MWIWSESKARPVTRESVDTFCAQVREVEEEEEEEEKYEQKKEEQEQEEEEEQEESEVCVQDNRRDYSIPDLFTKVTLHTY